MSTSLTEFNFALLGLLNRGAATGYDLMRVFETTPLGGYSSSPGAIYPALKKLRAGGFIEKTGPGNGGRGSLLAITADGAKVLKSWVRSPAEIRNESVVDVSIQMLKFTFAGDVLTRRQQLTFIEDFARVLTGAIAGLEQARGELSDSLGRHDMLAIDAGLMSYRAMLDWCALAQEQLA